MHLRHALPLALPMALLLGACSDYGFGAPEGQNEAGQPMIDVTPRSLDFLSAQAGDVVVRSFTVANVGDVYLAVDALVLDAPGSFTLVDAPDRADLMPGEWIEVQVAYTPLEPGELTGTVTVESSDADEPSIPVALLGAGLVPQLEVTPADFDFGAQTVTCAADMDVILQNVGAADLTVDALDYVGDAGLAVVEAPELPFVLEPGAYTTATVQFLPVAEGEASGVLTVGSDDPTGDRSAAQSGSGVGAVDGEESFPIDPDPPLDILFAVDQSGSMDDDAAALGENFTSFIAQIGNTTGDWQVGVVTLDEGCLNSGVLTDDTVGVFGLFESAVSLGSDLDVADDEALLKLSDTALGQVGAGECNEGFLREGANLHVIVVSDEPERSHEQAAAWTWDFWVERMQGYVSEPHLLTISGVVDRDGCSEGDDGYAQAIAATGGEHLDICDDRWGDHVAALAGAALSRLWTYTLDGEPEGSSVTVLVDGVEVDGWTWDADARTVTFEERPDGSTLTVRYAQAATCD